MKDNIKLINQNTLIHRQYFREMCKLIGIDILFRAPKKGLKKYTTYGELDTYYEEPIKIGCIFDNHPNQQTLKKLGWVSELQEGSSIIHVDYDLEGLEQGALFILPSGIDNGKDRLFRLVKMQVSMVYPSSIACEIVPEYIDNFNQVTDFNENPDSTNILGGEVYPQVSPLDEFELELKHE